MKNKKLNEDIVLLNLDDRIVNLLKDNEINTINDLWNSNRKNLKIIGLNDHDISQIIINLQLMGMDLNKKIY